MSLSRLRWLTIILPIGFVLAVHLVVLLILEPLYGHDHGPLLAVAMVAALVAGIVVFSMAVFGVIGAMQDQIVQKSDELAARSRGIQALNQVGIEITSLQDVKETLRSITEHARELLNSDAASICLLEEEGGLVLAGCSGPPEAFLRAPVQIPPFPLAAVRSPERLSPAGCPVLTKEYRAACVSSPVRLGETRLGELCVCSRASKEVNPFQRELLAGLADMAAIALNNSRLLERERYVAILEERERLAREMHDSVAQVLGYLHLKAQTCSELLAREKSEKVRDGLQDIASLAQEGYVDVREGILALRETTSLESGIVQTLEDYLEKYRRQSGIDVELQNGGGDLPLSPEAELQVLRVIQEALTNVRKHSGAKRARVTIIPGRRLVRITVEDNGRGFHATGQARHVSRGLGLRTMRERIDNVGGQLRIDSRPGEGTRVEISFPLTEGGDEL